jgi:hypothetical protein
MVIFVIIPAHFLFPFIFSIFQIVTVIQELGRGSFGAVYEVEENETGKTKAMKVCCSRCIDLL